MKNKLTKILKNAKYEPDTKMALSVWQTIVKQERRSTHLKLWSLSSLLFVSTVGLIPAFEILLSDLAHSGFYEYFSLIFSDSGLMFSYWKEFTLSLAESLPMMSIIFTLSLVFIFLLSVRYMLKQAGRNQFISFGTLSV